MGTTHKQTINARNTYSRGSHLKGIIFPQGKRVDKERQRREQQNAYEDSKRRQPVRSIKTLKRRAKNRVAKLSRKMNRV